jgi:hypothetical protein
MTDDLALAISRDHWNEFATLDLVPVTVRREHLWVHVGVAIHCEKAAGDCRRITSLRQVDRVVARAACDCGSGW